jgi:hypothetical protein
MQLRFVENPPATRATNAIVEWRTDLAAELE